MLPDKLPGKPEDLIPRRPECTHCIFEDILNKEQRKWKVLKKGEEELTEDDAERFTIEQLCGSYHPQVCYLKYAAQRSAYDNFMALQFGAIKDLLWDMGKGKHDRIGYEEGLREWTKTQDLGRGIPESYAERFRIIYTLGMRGKKQTLTSTAIYDRAVSTPKLYDDAISVLKRLKQESEERDRIQ